MATSSKIQLSTSEPLAFGVPNLTKESAGKASDLLQANHENHHIFFNEDGFHNHVSHHLLTIFALGADPGTIHRQYDDNASYQRPIKLNESEREVKDFSDHELFKKNLFNYKCYYDYLLHFQREIEAKGWEAVLNEYLFAGDERADDLLVRLYAGFLHPLIHLGFGVEFRQPAIIAEALAQAALHDTWIGELLVTTEKAASKHGVKGSKSLVHLLEEIRQDQKLAESAHFKDGNKIRDGVLARAPEDMVKYAAQYTVRTEDLDERAAEMMNTALYFTAAAQNPKKIVKFDFYFMHCVNCSIFFTSLNKVPQISVANKVRLLEWKGRLDLAMYVSRRVPEPQPQEIVEYKPKRPGDNWEALIKRVNALGDDGHAPKLLRAVAHAEQASKPYEHKDSFRVKGDMWLQIAHMVVDSVEDEGPKWIRSCGFAEAWDEIPNRKMAAM